MGTSGFKPKPLKDQVIVITGASSGIGLATAKRAVQRGARVVISSRNTLALNEVAKEIQTMGGDVLVVPADVSSFKEVQMLRDRALERFGTIDTWVNNAGLSIFGYIMETPLEEEEKLFAVNFWGVRHGSRVAVSTLAEKGGVLINVGSEASGRSIPLQGMYAASKHAVKAYTDALRMELEKLQMPIEVCLVRPAAIDTPFALHARNELHGGAPSLPSPVYHPNVAADSILRCAEKPQRDVYIGSAARLLTILEALMPRWLDLFMEKKMFDVQSRGSKFPHVKANEALFHPPLHEGQIRGGHKGRVSKWSLYTKLTS
jgi:short-subunit dehydrogenase